MNQSINPYCQYNIYLSVLLTFLSPLCASANRMDTLLSTTKVSSTEDYASVNKDLAHYYSSPFSKKDDINTRLITALDIYQARPYQYDSVGDGPEGDFDNRPIIATHGFDCMTLTNTVLAMVVSDNLSTFYNNYTRIRYQSLPRGYFKRHHFISFQWHPHNVQLGFIKDITSTIQVNNQAIATLLKTAINYPNWLVFQKKLLSKNQALSSQQNRIWQQAMQESSAVQARVPYIKFTDFLASSQTTSAILKQIPGGSIVYFVTPHWDLREVIGTELDIAHLGFITVRDRTHYITHASLKGVVTLPLVDYIRKVKENNKRFSGFNVEQILIPNKHIPEQPVSVPQ